MRLHVIEGLALFALGALGVVEWVRDLWRSRTDADVDRHPQAVALRALAERAPAPAPPSVRAVLAEQLRRREVIAECEFFDIEAATEAGEPSRCERG